MARDLTDSDEKLADALVGRRIVSLGVMRYEYDDDVIEKVALKLDSERTIEISFWATYASEAGMEIHDITEEPDDA
jgi:hypothetical protein